MNRKSKLKYCVTNFVETNVTLVKFMSLNVILYGFEFYKSCSVYKLQTFEVFC